MRTILRVFTLTSSLAIVLATPLACSPAAAQAPDAEQTEQAPLTAKEIEGVLAGHKDIEAVVAKLPQKDDAKPDPKVLAQLDAIVKKYGFASYDAYDQATANIALVMSGFDPTTKAYVGPEAVIKSQIAAVKADAQMPPLDKKKAIDELMAAEKSVEPVRYPENIKLVGQYFDKLSAALPDD